MKIEHKLAPAIGAYTRQAQEQLRELRIQYLATLGQAKEIEMQIALVRQALAQQLALVEAAESLPKSTTPYALSQDGLSLIGEAAENPRAVNGGM